MAVTHLFESLVPDGNDDTQVRSSDWNAAHVLSNALKAIDGLTPAASKIAYFTGTDSATLTDITATGISLLGAANAAGARTTLELGTIATQAANNVSLTGGSISGITSIGGVLLSLASDSGAEHVFCKTNDTSNSNQSCVFALRHYSSASEESATAFRMVSESGVNQLYLGGGALAHNACTMIKFYTASNNTTLGGSERGRVTSAGRLLWGTTTDNGVDALQVNGTIKSTGLKLSDTNEILWGDGSCKISGSGSTGIITATAGTFRHYREIAIGANYWFTTNITSAGQIGHLWYGKINQSDQTKFVGTHATISATRFYSNNANDFFWGHAPNNGVGGELTFTNRMSFQADTGRLLLGPTLPTDNGIDALQVNGTIASTGYKLSELNTAPASASATGTLGEIRITADAIYICTATNTWKKCAIATW